MKIYITYQTPVYRDHKFNIIDYKGPYMKIFDTQEEAEAKIKEKYHD